MNPLIHSAFRRKHYHIYADIGYKRMERSRAFICCLARDCAGALHQNIPKIEALRSNFLDSRVIVVENDSKDGTKEVLANWADQAKGVTIISHDYHTTTIPAVSHTAQPAFSFHRISKMAAYRNKYMQQMDEMDFEADYVLIMDVDVSGFDLRGIANTFGQPLAWDMVSANGRGVSSSFFNLLRHTVYYDTYAFRGQYEEAVQTPDLICSQQYMLSYLKKGLPMLPVYSGFNGLGIYRREAIVGLRYEAKRGGAEGIEVYCEHIPLHEKMRERGFNKIYINPSQIVIYETVWQSYLDSFRRLIGRIKPLVDRKLNWTLDGIAIQIGGVEK